MTLSAHDLALNRRAEAAAVVVAIRRRIHKASELQAAEEALLLATQEVDRLASLPPPRKKTGAKQG